MQSNPFQSIVFKTVKKKNFEDVKNIYYEIKDLLSGNDNKPNVFELTCDKVQDKLITFLAKEVISVQIYEKSAVAGGSKRPGFSLDT